jgi:hypothetical protein
VTFEDFLAAVVAAIGNSFEFVDAEDLLRLRGNFGPQEVPKLASFRPAIRERQQPMTQQMFEDDRQPLRQFS